MQQTESLEKHRDIDNDIQNEISIQNEIKKATDSFQDTEIIGAKVLECDYEQYNGSYDDTHKIKYDSKTYYVNKDENSSPFSRHKKVYWPVFILNYGGVEKVFSCKIHDSKEEANDKIRSLNKYYEGNSDMKSFRYYIESEDSIIHNLNPYKFLENIMLPKIWTRHIDYFYLYMIPLLIFLMSTTIYYITQGKEIPFTVLIFPFIISSIPVLAQKFIYTVRDNVNRYEMVDIAVEVIQNSNDLKQENCNYKSIEAKVDIDESGLTIYSDKLDCKWFYERKKNTQIEDSGVKLLNELPIADGKCALTVKDKGYNDSSWLSTNDEWWIDTESSFN
jgi:hypothetical protein